MAPEVSRVELPAGGFRRITVLRLSSIGDIVLTLPVVHALRAAFPAARLDYWVKEEYRDLVGFDTAVTHVRALERDARRVEDLVSMSAELEESDLIVDLHANLRTRILTFRQQAPVLVAPTHRWARERWVRAKWSRPAPAPHALQRYATALRPLGLAAPGPPRLEVGEQAEGWAREWVAAQAFAQPAWVFAPGAQHATKRWPEASWIELLSRAQAEGLPVIVLSTTAERKAAPELAAAVAAAGSARWVTESLARAGALLSHAAGAVTCDSGLMHMAAARGRRVVALFGSTSPVLGFAPCGEGHQVLGRGLPCRPCTVHGRESCPLGHFRCMRDLSVEQVWQALVAIRGR